jgi:hypothetical protein
MGLKKKAKRLDWWVEKFGEKEGKKLFLEQQRHRRKRTLTILSGIPVIGAIAKLILKVP